MICYVEWIAGTPYIFVIVGIPAVIGGEGADMRDGASEALPVAEHLEEAVIITAHKCNDLILVTEWLHFHILDPPFCSVMLSSQRDQVFKSSRNLFDLAEMGQLDLRDCSSVSRRDINNSS